VSRDGIGGSVADKAFNKFLVKLLGKDLMVEPKDEDMDSYLEIFRELEMKKRIAESQNKVTIQLSVSILELYKRQFGKTLSMSIILSAFVQSVEIRRNNILINANYFNQFS